MFGESSNRPDNEFLIDSALTFFHPINLAYRYPHSLGQFRQVLIAPVAEFENLCLDYHNHHPVMTDGYIIAINMPVVKPLHILSVIIYLSEQGQPPIEAVILPNSRLVLDSWLEAKSWVGYSA